MGVRLVRRHPLFAAAAIVVLAVGIGASTAVYSVLRVVVFRPLPYDDPDRILQLISESPSGVNRLSSAPQFLFWRGEGMRAFESIAAYQDRAPGLTLIVEGRAEAVRALRVSAEYFNVFRIPMARGRAFSGPQDRGSGPMPVVLSDGFWRRYFGEAEVVGRSLWLANEPHEIVGITARSFLSDPAADVFVPLRADGSSHDHTRQLRVVGRLRENISLAYAQSQVFDGTPHFRREHPFALGQYEYFGADTLHAVTIGPVAPTLRLVTWAVVLVLVVACANVAMLLLSRGRQREAEVAARAALGASRFRIARQLLTETMCLAVAGAVLALPIAQLGLHALTTFGATRLPDAMREVVSGITIDVDLILVAMTGGLVTGVLCGMLPATTTSRADLTSIFKSGASSAASSWRPGNAQSVLLLAEVAITLVLLTSTVIMLDSIRRLRAMDRGFDAANVLAFDMPLAGTHYRDLDAIDALIRNTTTRLASAPGVSSAAAAFVLPTDSGAAAPFLINNRTLLARGAHHGVVRWEVVSADYFATLRVPRLDGRVFSADDARGAPPVAIVNRAMALRFWGGRSALGERITLGGGDWPDRDVTRHIVGIVGDVRGTETPGAEPTIYIPATQAGGALLARQQTVAPLRWIVRSRGDDRSAGRALARLIERAAPGVAVVQAQSMAEILSAQVTRARFTLQLLGAFALVSIVLAAVGLYGFVASGVAARRTELGIRAAIGASGDQLVRLVTRQGSAIVVCGLATGIVASVAAGTLIEGTVAGTRALPLLTVTALAGVQLVIALGAAIVAALPALDSRSPLR